MNNEKRQQILSHLRYMHKALNSLLPAHLIDDFECDGFALAYLEKIRSDIQIMQSRIEILQHDIKAQPSVLTGNDIRLYQTQVIGRSDIGISCNESSCPHKHDCAQHDSAGEYRSEDGFTPLIFEHQGEYYCPQRVSKTNRGFLTVKDGELVFAFEGYYDER